MNNELFIYRGDAETRRDEEFLSPISASSRLRGEKSCGSWLPDMDLNHDKQIQSLLCYRYTIGQAGAFRSVNLSFRESRFVATLN